MVESSFVIYLQFCVGTFHTKTDSSFYFLGNGLKRFSRFYFQAGQHVCLPVQYEDLVLHPKKAMERVLNFLDVPWDDWVIHHEQTIGKEKGVSLSQ